MSKGLIRQWMADWLDWADVKPRSDGISSPFTALQQALGIIALIFAEPVLKNLTGLSPNQILIIRLVFLGLIICLCHYVVVAKGETSPSEKTAPAPLTYKYSELERLTSKIVLPLSLVLLVILVWPEPKPCTLSVVIHRQGQAYYGSASPAYLGITGGGEFTQFPITDSGASYILVSPKQKKRWILSIVLMNGTKMAEKEFRGCPNGKQEILLDNQTILEVRPR